MKKTLLLVALAAATCANAQLYPISFDAAQGYNNTDRHLDAVALSSGFGDFTVSVSQTLMYNCALQESLIAAPGETVYPSVGYTGSWMSGYVFVDWDRDGSLSESSELVSYSALQTNGIWKNSIGETLSNGNNLNTPRFTIPADAKEGFYGIRYKVDWNSSDPAGSSVNGNDIVSNRGAIADTRLLVRSSREAKLSLECEHATITRFDGSPIGDVAIGEELPLRIIPDEGYVFKSVTLRHGFLTGDSLVANIPQRAYSTITEYDAGLITIPATIIDGDLELTVNLEQGQRDEQVWKLMFNDEFNQADGSRPDSTKWTTSTRYASVWNRFISSDIRAAFIEKGKLVCRCLPTPSDAQPSDTLKMISGAVETKGKFSFTYGKAEARVKTNPYKGNFPAFWMMPQPPCEKWPNAGEIDIWEQIDTENRAYHTVHSNWTYNLKKTGNPKSSYNEQVDMSQWHVYTLVWTEDLLTWYVDGEQVASYAKSTTQSNLNQGQWPFDHDFYLICNQSVGNGSWASNFVEGHTYETLFDWVRVYQKVNTTEETAVETPTITDGSNGTARDEAFDLSGRKIPTYENVSGKLLIVNGKKQIFK